MNGKNRAALIAFVGAYLVYTAYGLYRDRADTDTTMTPAARTLFIALFVLAAAALIVYAVRLWMRSAKEEREQQSWKDENSMK